MSAIVEPAEKEKLEVQQSELTAAELEAIKILLLSHGISELRLRFEGKLAKQWDKARRTLNVIR